MISAILLAAGLSSRMGRPKALLPLPAGGTFLSHLLNTLQAAEVDDVVVVIGHQGDAVASSLSDGKLPARMAVNRAYRSGQLSSVIIGLNAVDRPEVDAILLALVDVPLVSAQTVRMVMDRYRTTHAPVVRPVHGGRHGHPVLIDRSLFGALRALDAETGMKPLVRANASEAGDVEVDDEGAFADIDTPEDYQRLFRPT
jgi:molybdenum cofactor cytidylyltransferase